MKLLYFCPQWGQEHLSWADLCRKVKDAGYDGIETSLPDDEAETAIIVETINRHGLQWIGQHWNTATADYHQHIKEYEQRLRAMAAAKPLLITSHTGRDFFNFEQNEHLLNLGREISAETGVKIIHETHRGKFSFAAHITKGYLEKLPWLQLTLDISHWFAVAESYLADQVDAVQLALLHTRHIHARIGYKHGPQVHDPRSPEWEEVMQTHLLLWDEVLKLQQQQGATQFTFTPEFGPYPYMQLMPFTDKPLADQWEVNLYMMNLLKRRYANLQH